MKTLFSTFLILAITSPAFAAKDCTNEPKEKYMKVEDFKKKVEGMGYKIDKFKTPGSCYEIYGKNSEGQKVEIYFNPVDASIVKTEIH